MTSARETYSSLFFFSGDDSGMLREFWKKEGNPSPIKKSTEFKRCDEIKPTRNDRMTMFFSVKSPDFTTRENIEIFAGWSLHNFVDSTIALTGIFQLPTILFELIFTRVLLEFSKTQDLSLLETKEHNHFKPLPEEIEKAKLKAEKLERDAVTKIISYLDATHENNPGMKVIRDNHTSIETPPFPSKLKNKKEKNAGAPSEVKESAKPLEDYMTPPFVEHEKDKGRYLLVRARQRIQKLPTQFILSDQYESYIEKIKSSRKIFQIFSSNFLTDKTTLSYHRANLIFNNLMKDKELKAEFDITIDKLKDKRLRGEFEKLPNKILGIIFNKYKLINKNKGIIADNNIDNDIIDQLHIPENRKFVIDYLIHYDYLNLKSLARNFTEELLLSELPVFLQEVAKAKAHFKKTQGVSYHGYPIAKSLGKEVFDFTVKMIRKAFGDNYQQYFDWADTTPLLTEKAKHSHKIEKPRP